MFSLLGSTISGWLGFFCVVLGKMFSVGLFGDQLFQPTSNQVETVEKAFA